MIGEASLVLLERQLAHEPPVHPPQLLLVEHRGRPADPREVEALDQLLGTHQGGVVVGPPPQQREVVADRGGEVPGGAQLLDGGAAMALRELLAVRRVEQRQVRVARRRGPERPQHHQLPRSVREMVVAANHVGDLHFRVVDGDREVVEHRTVAARDHEVVEEAVLEPDLTPDRVLDNRLALVRDPQPDRGSLDVPGSPR